MFFDETCTKCTLNNEEGYFIPKKEIKKLEKTLITKISTKIQQEIHTITQQYNTNKNNNTTKTNQTPTAEVEI